TFGLSVHVGLDGTTANQGFQEPCCAYDAGLGTDAKTGEVVLAWFSNAPNDQGLHSATVLPARGVTKYLPGSGTDDHASAASPDGKLAVTGRPGAAGVYVAYGVGYPTWRVVNLWEHESGKTTRVAFGQNIRSPFAAPGPAGRLWVAWRDGNAIFATRTN